MADLIDLDFARQHIPLAVDTDEAFIAGAISSASRAIQRYCRRDFVSTAYDELYNGTADRRLILRQYPIISVQSVRYRPVTVLKVTNSSALVQQARVTVTPTGLTLFKSISGVPTTDTSITWAGNPTIIAVANAITALGGGWQGQGGFGYDLWPSADLYTPQGALTAQGQFAELKMHTYELAGYQIDARRGWLLRAIPYSDPELLHPEDLVFPTGINNFRVQYTAGYATVPEDVQEAAGILVASMFAERGRDAQLHLESTAGSYRYLSLNSTQLPPRVQQLLKPYRNYRVQNNMA
jgi:hypothetical protein